MRRRRALLVLVLGILPTVWIVSQVDPGQAHNCSFVIVTLQGTTSTAGNPNCTDDVSHTCNSTNVGTVDEIVCVHNP